MKSINMSYIKEINYENIFDNVSSDITKVLLTNLVKIRII